MINKIIFNKMEKGQTYDVTYGDNPEIYRLPLGVKGDPDSVITAMVDLLDCHTKECPNVISDLHVFTDGERFGMGIIPVDGLPKMRWLTDED
jgi:hypothetical protein